MESTFYTYNFQLEFNIMYKKHEHHTLYIDILSHNGKRKIETQTSFFQQNYTETLAYFLSTVYYVIQSHGIHNLYRCHWKQFLVAEKHKETRKKCTYTRAK